MNTIKWKNGYTNEKECHLKSDHREAHHEGDGNFVKNDERLGVY